MPVQTNLAPPLSGVQAKLSLARVVGTPTTNAWSQVHEFTPANPGKTEARGEFFAAVSVNNTALPSVDLGHEILTRLNEEYFGPDEFAGSPFGLLKSVVETVAREFGSQNLEIVSAVVWRGFLYLCILGPGKVFLWRDGKLATILAGGLASTAKPASQGEQGEGVSVSSGRQRENDVFILATSAFSETVSQAVLAGFLAHSSDIVQVADNITPLVHQASLPTVAGAIIQISGGQIAQQVSGSEVQGVGSSDVPVRWSTGLPTTGVPSSLTTRTSFFKNLLVNLALKLPEKVNTSSFRISSSGRKTAVSVGVLLLLLFALSIGFGLKQKQAQVYRSSYQEQLLQAESAYSESLQHIDVDPVRARELFVEAKKLTDELVERGIKDGKLDALRAQIAGSAADVLGEVTREANIFLDLSLVRSGITARELALDGQDLAILDSQGQRIVISEGRETASIGGAEKLANPRSIGVYAGRYFALGDEGVVELDRKGAVNNEINPDGWGQIAKIGVFGGNLYLLDRDSQVWRYTGVEGEFGEKQGWLGSSVKPDFSQVIDMAIDGSIWLLDANGTITRYTRGAPQIVRVQGLEKPFSSPVAFYTDEELENVYVLDRGKSRIVELTKSGIYEKQYLSGQIAEAVDFVVSKKAGKIYLLTPNKVLELPL